VLKQERMQLRTLSKISMMSISKHISIGRLLRAGRRVKVTRQLTLIRLLMNAKPQIDGI
jgi:hypothetical protein